MEFDDNPSPTKNDFPACWDLVSKEIENGDMKINGFSELYIEILSVATKIIILNELKNGNTEITVDGAFKKIAEIGKERDAFGVNKYGTRLQPFNGRDFLKDCLEEVLDLVVYSRGFIYEETEGSK